MSLTKADLRKRATSIGSSEAHKIVLRDGLHDVWLRLCHPELVLQSEHDSLFTRRGHALEPFVASEYERRREVKLARCRTTRHPSKRFLVASPDRLVLDAGGEVLRNVQIKTASGWMRDDWGPDGSDVYPLKYRIQVTLEGAVLGGVDSDLACYVDGESEIRVYPVPFDRELARLLEDELETFYVRHVLTRDPPPPDGSPSSASFLRKRFPENKGHVLEARPEDLALAKELREVKARIKELEQQKNRLEQFAKAITGEADEVRDLWSWRLPSKGKGKPAWKPIAEELRHELGIAREELRLRGATLNKLTDDTLDEGADPYPEILARHTKPPTRTFRLHGDEGDEPT